MKKILINFAIALILCFSVGGLVLIIMKAFGLVLNIGAILVALLILSILIAFTIDNLKQK